MHIRHVIVCLGILIIAQLVFFNYNQNEAIKTLEARSRQFDAHIISLAEQKQAGQEKLDTLVQVFNTVRPWLNTGFKDPERGFMKFLDFLEPGLLEAVGAKVRLSDRPLVEVSPVPLQKTSYQVSFNFKHPSQVESFLRALLLQHDYPLKVNFLGVNRGIQQEDTAKNQVGGTLSMDLLLPANLMHLSLEELREMEIL